jgi:hypothetical protein
MLSSKVPGADHFFCFYKMMQDLELPNRSPIFIQLAVHMPRGLQGMQDRVLVRGESMAPSSPLQKTQEIKDNHLEGEGPSG